MTLESVRDRLAATGDTPPTLKDQIEALGVEIERALPGTIDADRFVRNTITVFRQTPRLASCTWPSIAGALMTAAQVGLEPGPLGHCWLIPRGSEATFQLGYTGLVELARRSGSVGAIRTGVIYDWSELDERDGTDPHLVIVPVRPRPDDATPLAYWCVVERVDGASDHWSVMELHEIEAARDKIPGAGRAGSAWRENFDAMACITVFRRMKGMLPLSIEMATALDSDGQVVTEREALDAAPPASALAPVSGAHVPAVGTDTTASARAVPVAGGGPIPDGEPWEPVEDLPSDTADDARHEQPSGGFVVEQSNELLSGDPELGAPEASNPGDITTGPGSPAVQPKARKG